MKEDLIYFYVCLKNYGFVREKIVVIDDDFKKFWTMKYKLFPTLERVMVIFQYSDFVWEFDTARRWNKKTGWRDPFILHRETWANLNEDQPTLLFDNGELKLIELH